MTWEFGPEYVATVFLYPPFSLALYDGTELKGSSALVRKSLERHRYLERSDGEKVLVLRGTCRSYRLGWALLEGCYGGEHAFVDAGAVKLLLPATRINLQHRLFNKYSFSQGEHSGANPVWFVAVGDRLKKGSVELVLYEHPEKKDLREPLAIRFGHAHLWLNNMGESEFEDVWATQYSFEPSMPGWFNHGLDNYDVKRLARLAPIAPDYMSRQLERSPSDGERLIARVLHAARTERMLPTDDLLELLEALQRFILRGGDLKSRTAQFLAAIGLITPSPKTRAAVWVRRAAVWRIVELEREGLRKDSAIAKVAMVLGSLRDQPIVVRQDGTFEVRRRPVQTDTESSTRNLYRWYDELGPMIHEYRQIRDRPKPSLDDLTGNFVEVGLWKRVAEKLAEQLLPMEELRTAIVGRA